jgi:hypothetical protein
MYIHLGFHFFLNGHCPGLVDIHQGDKSTSKDLKLLVISLYPGFHLFLIGIYLGNYSSASSSSPLFTDSHTELTGSP